jgi:triacylglycerol esterase/lipase EstA (alpha/beta hydrolase family)
LGTLLLLAKNEKLKGNLGKIFSTITYINTAKKCIKINEDHVHIRRIKMRFLVVSMSRQALPMEASGMMIEAMKGWVKQNQANKKAEQFFGFAGMPGGGGILNVASFEELDAIMTEFPLGQFSDTQIYPLTDLEKSLENAANVIKKIMPPKK